MFWLYVPICYKSVAFCHCKEYTWINLINPNLTKCTFSFENTLDVWLCSADVCYTKNDAYDIMDHGQQCHSSEEAKKVIYEEVSKECWTLELPNSCINALSIHIVSTF